MILVSTSGFSYRGWERIGPFGYVRLHGRNAEKWYEHEHAWQRSDNIYSHNQLEKPGEAVRKLSGEESGEDETPPEKRDTYVFFNNPWQAQGVVNAMQLRLIPGEKLPEDLPEAIEKRLSQRTGDGGEA